MVGKFIGSNGSILVRTKPHRHKLQRVGNNRNVLRSNKQANLDTLRGHLSSKCLWHTTFHRMPTSQQA